MVEAHVERLDGIAPQIERHARIHPGEGDARIVAAPVGRAARPFERPAIGVGEMLPELLFARAEPDVIQVIRGEGRNHPKKKRGQSNFHVTLKAACKTVTEKLL